MDYDIRLNDVIQLMIKLVASNNEIKENNLENSLEKRSKNEEHVETSSQYYKLGDLVDVRLSDTGAWYEARITKIFKKGLESKSLGASIKEDIYFRVKRLVKVGSLLIFFYLNKNNIYFTHFQFKTSRC